MRVTPERVRSFHPRLIASRVHACLTFSRTSNVKAMLNPSRADCIAILSAASRIADQTTLIDLDYKNLGMSRNGMETAASFLIERDCFMRHREINGQVA